MGKDTIKVKRKCCHSKPPCKTCPIVVLREALKESKAEEARQNEKRAPKKTASELPDGRDSQNDDQQPVPPNTLPTGRAPSRNPAPLTLLEQAEAIVAQRYSEPETADNAPSTEEAPERAPKEGAGAASDKSAGKSKKKNKKSGKKKDAV